MGENGEQGEHEKGGKYQPDDLKHFCDSKHPICTQTTLFGNQRTQNTMYTIKNYNIHAWIT